MAHRKKTYLSWFTAGVVLAYAAPAHAALSVAGSELRLRAVGDGYAQLQASDSTGNAAALGVGLDAEGEKLEAAVFYRQGSADSIQGRQSEFGAFILTPSGGGFGFTGELAWYFGPASAEVRKRFGLRGRVATGQADWVIPASGDIPEEKRTAVGMSSAAGGAFKYKLSQPGADNPVSVVFSVMGTMRSVRGDAGNSTTFLRQTIQSSEREYFGWDLSTDLHIKDVFASVTYARVYRRPAVDGLTGGQLLISIGIRTGLELK